MCVYAIATNLCIFRDTHEPARRNTGLINRGRRELNESSESSEYHELNKSSKHHQHTLVKHTHEPARRSTTKHHKDRFCTNSMRHPTITNSMSHLDITNTLSSNTLTNLRIVQKPKTHNRDVHELNESRTHHQHTLIKTLTNLGIPPTPETHKLYDSSEHHKHTYKTRTNLQKPKLHYRVPHELNESSKYHQHTNQNTHEPAHPAEPRDSQQSSSRTQ